MQYTRTHATEIQLNCGARIRKSLMICFVIPIITKWIFDWACTNPRQTLKDPFGYDLDQCIYFVMKIATAVTYVGDCTEPGDNSPIMAMKPEGMAA